MNTKGTEYGSVFINKKGYQVEVINPITKKKEYLGYYAFEHEAHNALNKWNFNFFSQNSWALPRCISLNRRDMNFVFSVQIKGKTVRVSSSKSLDCIVNEKLLFLTQMI